MARIVRTIDDKPLLRFGSKHPVRQECYLCRNKDKLTKEHVVCRNAFQPNDLEHPIILSACEPCNTKKEFDEAYAVSHFLLTTETAEAKIPRDRYFDQIKRKRPSVILPKGKDKVPGMGLFNKMMATMSDADIYSPQGIFLGVGGQIPIDSQRMTNFYVNICKGLFTSAAGRVLDWPTFKVLSQFDSLMFNKFMKKEAFLFPIQNASFHEGRDRHFIFAGFVYTRPNGKLASMWSVALYNDQVAVVSFMEE